MLLQTGRFIVKNIQELERVVPNQNGIKRIFDLDYMGDMNMREIQFQLQEC